MFQARSKYTVTLHYCMFLLVSILCLNCNPAWAGDNKSLLPEDLPLKKDYSPGSGSMVGELEVLSGKAYIVHAAQDYIYLLGKGSFFFKKEYRVFANDTIITGTQGRSKLKLKDESIVVMVENTKLVLDKNVFDPDKKSRSSLMRMLQGKARFMIKGFSDYKESQVEIKTNTAMAGIRGSDFLVFATLAETEVITFQDTVLRVSGLANMDKFVTLTEKMRTVIRKGEVPERPEAVSAKEIEDYKQQFSLQIGKESGHFQSTGEGGGSY